METKDIEKKLLGKTLQRVGKDGVWKKKIVGVDDTTIGEMCVLLDDNEWVSFIRSQAEELAANGRLTFDDVEFRIKECFEDGKKWEERVWDLSTKIFLASEQHADVHLHIDYGEAIGMACDFIVEYRKIMEL